MRAGLVFLGKEFCEQTRTFRLMILLLVFLLLGIMNPLTAWFLPDLMNMLAEEGIRIDLPAPSMADAWTQFYKNVPQIGLPVLVILFAGLLPSELEKGTLLPFLARGLSRNAALLSKYAASVLIWGAACFICVGATWGYTLYFFGEAGEAGGILLAALFLWLFGALLLAAELLGGVLTGSIYGALLTAGVLTVLLFLLGMILKSGEVLPIALISGPIGLITGQEQAEKFLIPALVCTVLTGGIAAGACAAFQRKKL